jgi:hypothetical protein
VQYYRTTALFLPAPPASVPDRTPANHEGLTDVSPAEPARAWPTLPRPGPREP